MIELNLPAKHNYMNLVLSQKEHWAKQKTIIFESESEFGFFLDIYQWHHRPFKVIKASKYVYPVEFLDMEEEKTVD